ncbi:DUF397 domain-containing protein [Actinomadura craniellae]|uniref:DUF397 domain-containing protein n=1 Tax=Actinomadura craniellae TaxID=2231787 RepID=A0A365GWB8_9ACTN|nr:DUF397 domain-containing protein [Actinomadura craniellae]RAY11062.1 DUF397 domain-containing protein [Actinomadura craniellae]
MIDLSHAIWRKSHHSGTGDNCVELAALPGVVAIRDSKNPQGGTLILTREIFRIFTETLKKT